MGRRAAPRKAAPLSTRETQQRSRLSAQPRHHLSARHHRSEKWTKVLADGGASRAAWRLPAIGGKRKARAQRHFAYLRNARHLRVWAGGQTADVTKVTARGVAKGGGGQ